MPQIDIALATYNGAKFIEEQLDSILRQTHTDWRLIVRDDGSDDESRALLEDQRPRFGDRMTIIDDDDGNVGFVENFSRLVCRSDAPYTALCDQDDVWLPEKLAWSLERMQRMEAEHAPDTPSLVFTDLRIVDEHLTPIAPSMWEWASLDPGWASNPATLLSQNTVTGNTVMINAALRELGTPIPARSAAHDWWLATVAAAFGRTGFVGTPTVLYRQHANNRIGALRPRPHELPRAALRAVAHPSPFTGAFLQAQAMLDRFGDDLRAEDRAALETFLTLPDMPLPKRAYVAARNGVLPGRRLRSIHFIVASGRSGPAVAGPAVSSRSVPASAG